MPILEVVGGIAIGLTIGKLCTRIGEKLDDWLEDRSNCISRQRAANYGIRADMDLHPVEKGDWK